MRTLASIQRVVSVEPIPEADAIEKIKVLGWELVAKKGDFKPDDLCVYVEVDSVLPDKPAFEFMRARKFRVKTIRLRGQISQGLTFPISILEGVSYVDNTNPEEPVLKPVMESITEGMDLSETLGIVKYEAPEEGDNSPGTRSKTKGNFPSWISKTDETRIQAAPGVLVDAVGTHCYVAEKIDGSSMTVFLKKNDETGEFNFGVCSRNQEKKDTEGCYFWEQAHRLDLENKLRAFQQFHAEEFPDGIALQGECAGPGIQKNRQNLPKRDFLVFNVYNIGRRSYLGFPQWSYICKELGVCTVPILDTDFVIKETTVASLITMATRKTAFGGDFLAEGIVVRPWEEGYHRKLGRFSFKAISPEYLLKHSI